MGKWTGPQVLPFSRRMGVEKYGRVREVHDSTGECVCVCVCVCVRIEQAIERRGGNKKKKVKNG
jgi:hypothetical protein